MQTFHLGKWDHWGGGGAVDDVDKTSSTLTSSKSPYAIMYFSNGDGCGMHIDLLMIGKIIAERGMIRTKYT